MKIILLCSLVGIMLCACNEKHKDFFPVQNFEQIFMDSLPHDKDILVVLTHRDCHACDMLKQRICSDEKMINKLLHDYSCFEYPVDRIGFEFFNCLLYQYSFPIMVVFSKNGDLKALIAGAKAADELIDIRNTLDKKERFVTNLENKLFISENDYASLISSTLKAFLSYHRGDTLIAQKEILKSTELHEYFYNLYLGAKITQVMQDSSSSLRFAQKAQCKNCEFDEFLYHNLFEELSYITGNNVKYSERQFVVVPKNKFYDCGKVKMNEKCEFEFELKNVDTLPVIIQNVDKACNCMQIDWSKQPICPGQTGYIKVRYDTSEKGFFQKVLFVNLNRNIKPIPLWVKGFIE